MHDVRTLAETEQADLQPYLDVNVLAPFAITRVAVEQLRRSDAPRVVFISSQWGQVPDGHSYGYMVSKAAQLGLMKALAKELVGDGILVNAIAPGAVDTRMIPDHYYDDEVAAVPLGRLADPGEISSVVAFVAEDTDGLPDLAELVRDSAGSAVYCCVSRAACPRLVLDL
jgi:3-oxoacyl-[acyl-carrier protein] reductase